MNYFYINHSGEKVGPVSIDDLRAAGIMSTTQVWCEGMTDWMPAGSVSELSGIFAHNPPPFTGAQQANTNTQQQPIKPNNCLAWAILSTIFCCLPFGIVGIVYASSVDTKFYAGDYQGAEKAAKSARTWTIASAVSGIVFSFIYFVVIMAAGVGGAFIGF